MKKNENGFYVSGGALRLSSVGGRRRRRGRREVGDGGRNRRRRRTSPGRQTLTARAAFRSSLNRITADLCRLDLLMQVKAI